MALMAGLRSLQGRTGLIVSAQQDISHELSFEPGMDAAQVSAHFEDFIAAVEQHCLALKEDLLKSKLRYH